MNMIDDMVVDVADVVSACFAVPVFADDAGFSFTAFVEVDVPMGL